MTGRARKRLVFWLNRAYWWVALYALLLLFALGRRLEFPEVW